MIIAFFIIYSMGVMDGPSGHMYSLYMIGCHIMGMSIVIVNTKIATLSHQWNIALTFTVFGGMIVYLITISIAGLDPTVEVYNVIPK
jgi:hypothetical protein